MARDGPNLVRFNVQKSARALGLVKDDDDGPLATFFVNKGDSIGWVIDMTAIDVKPKYREMLAAYLARAANVSHEDAYTMLFDPNVQIEGFKR